MSYQITGATQISVKPDELTEATKAVDLSSHCLLKWYSNGSGISVHLSVLPSEHARSP